MELLQFTSHPLRFLQQRYYQSTIKLAVLVYGGIGTYAGIHQYTNLSHNVVSHYPTPSSVRPESPQAVWLTGEHRLMGCELVARAEVYPLRQGGPCRQLDEGRQGHGADKVPAIVWQTG